MYALKMYALKNVRFETISEIAQFLTQKFCTLCSANFYQCFVRMKKTTEKSFQHFFWTFNVHTTSEWEKTSLQHYFKHCESVTSSSSFYLNFSRKTHSMLNIIPWLGFKPTTLKMIHKKKKKKFHFISTSQNQEKINIWIFNHPFSTT